MGAMIRIQTFKFHLASLFPICFRPSPILTSAMPLRRLVEHVRVLSRTSSSNAALRSQSGTDIRKPSSPAVHLPKVSVDHFLNLERGSFTNSMVSATAILALNNTFGC